jgi:hypothetical protein
MLLSGRRYHVLVVWCIMSMKGGRVVYRHFQSIRAFRCALLSICVVKRLVLTTSMAIYQCPCVWALMCSDADRL